MLKDIHFTTHERGVDPGEKNQAWEVMISYSSGAEKATLEWPSPGGGPMLFLDIEDAEAVCAAIRQAFPSTVDDVACIRRRVRPEDLGGDNGEVCTGGRQ